MSALKPGDLAIVVHGHCVHQVEECVGDIVTVGEISPDDTLNCWYCHGEMGSCTSAVLFGRKGRGHYPVAWLRKIEPLAELEKERAELERGDRYQRSIRTGIKTSSELLNE